VADVDTLHELAQHFGGEFGAIGVYGGKGCQFPKTVREVVRFAEFTVYCRKPLF